MDVAICKVLMEEVVELLLFCRGQGECPGVRELGPRSMAWSHAFHGGSLSKASLEKTSLKSQYWASTISLRGWLSSAFWASWANHCDGVHCPNALFLPLRGDEHSIDHISRFQFIILHCTSAWPPLTLRGASRHADALVSPVNLQVVMGKPQVSNDDGLSPKVCNHKVCLLHVLA